MTNKQVIAVDLGAESGRVIAVQFDGQALSLQPVHRFPNNPVQVRDTLHWDILRLWYEIQQGINAVAGEVASIGVDTWGVDFALLDQDKNLLANPVHYRDPRTKGMMAWVFERIPQRVIFDRTGIQFMVLNTLYQLASLARAKSPVLENAKYFVTIPDLINYWLSGQIVSEFTIATTTQLYNPHRKTWDTHILKGIGVSPDIFPKIIQPGTLLGEYHGIPVIAPACHDTGSAVVAVPTTTPNYAYLSSGTWSLLGVETQNPIINAAAFAANVTNEGGAFGTFRLLKNVMGLWLAQQCRVTWQQTVADYDYDELTRMAGEAEPFRSLIDPDDPGFFEPGDMPARIRSFCKRSGQPVPETPGQVMRTIYESLAFKYRYTLEKFITLTGNPVERLHIIGGGSQNELLNQMTANAIGRVVIAGPTEATALGNALMQLITLGELSTIQEGRELLSRSLPLTTYEPQETARWEAQYQRFESLLTTA
jgi:rhamnulokinase